MGRAQLQEFKLKAHIFLRTKAGMAVVWSERSRSRVVSKTYLAGSLAFSRSIVRSSILAV